MRSCRIVLFVSRAAFNKFVSILTRDSFRLLGATIAYRGMRLALYQFHQEDRSEKVEPRKLFEVPGVFLELI